MESSMIVTALKGFVVGATMLVPGVSGGSMAMLLGCYDKLIRAVSSFTRNIKENLTFLTIFALGGILGMMVFAKPITFLLGRYPIPVMYFFIGAVAGGAPLMWKKSEITKITGSTLFYLVIGATVVILMTAAPAELFGAGKNEPGMIMLLIVGAAAALALVLPGISVSYMFLVFGMYEDIMTAIADFNLAYLLPLGIGVLVGTILITKILENAMERHPGPVYLTIMGFILGSIVGVFPGIPAGSEWIFAALTLTAGFLVMYKISSLEVF